MRRKKRREEPRNHDRWVVSYADFITLLFAFFVVMYAISSLNEGKYRVVSNALQAAFGVAPAAPAPVALVSAQPVVVMPSPRIDPGLARARREERELKDAGERLARALAPLADKGAARVSLTPRGVVVEIGASALFASAEAKLDAAAAPTLKELAGVLAALPNALHVEGHTDNVPIATAQFPSNWELSSARAAAVARLLIDAGVPAGRVAVLGYGDTRPLVANDDADARARNRRVNVLVLARESAPAGGASWVSRQ
jgi:chemotaxis protein MotB